MNLSRRTQQRLLWCIACFVALLPLYGLVSQSSLQPASQTSPQFATWQGAGPDKWASIWLIERVIAPGTQVRLVEANTVSLSSDNKLAGAGVIAANTIWFDVPHSSYRQSGQQTSFEALRLAWQRGEIGSSSADEALSQRLQTMSRLLNDIELNTWQPDELEQSIIVEYAFRDLQSEFQRGRAASSLGKESVGKEGTDKESIASPSLRQVPRACYNALFDQLATLLARDGLNALNDSASIGPDPRCSIAEKREPEGQMHSLSSQATVAEISVAKLAEYFQRGQNVVFIDVRESAEFEEIRIPGARNVQIRNVNSDLLASLAEADLVVSYCVKDFRGYEMAQKLARAGVANSVIMKPYGINGWIKAGLPTYGQSPSTSHSEAQGVAALEHCLTGLHDKKSAGNAAEETTELNRNDGLRSCVEETLSAVSLAEQGGSLSPIIQRSRAL